MGDASSVKVGADESSCIDLEVSASKLIRDDERYAATPDGRYFVVRGRLWRKSNPGLSEAERASLTKELMSARRAKGVAMRAGDSVAREGARRRVDAAKHALGERGEVWWTDGAPDYNRHMAKNTPYAEWFAGLTGR